MTVERESIKPIANNKKAFHDYFVEERFEAGIELFGTEVNAIRAGGVNLKDSWCAIEGGEIFVNGMHISPYDKGNVFNCDSYRVRKLLMHKKEIMRLYGTLKQQGLTLIPLSVYFKGSLVKVSVGLCKGKKYTISGMTPQRGMPNATSTVQSRNAISDKSIFLNRNIKRNNSKK